MKAAYFKDYGAARDVLQIGELPDPQPAPARCACACASPASIRPTAIAAPARATGPAIR